MKNLKSYLSAAASLLLFCSSAVELKAVDYANPVMPGDFPDPSVIRVGDDYWATATCSEWAPFFPILHSKDLINWNLVGHVFQQKPSWSSRNYWAPEIAHHKGKFYVYYTGRKNETNGVLHVAVASAENPKGPWTDHGPLIGQPEGSIDGVPMTDEKGDLYMLWKNDGNSRKQPTMIWAQKLSDDGTRLVGQMKELFRNDAGWEGNLVEGPFPIKHGDYFYIFYAGNGCCGKGCTYATGVARSKSLLGPYEKCPRNPILPESEKWRCPGHGSIVTTADGRDFFLYHAYDRKDTVYVGRQGVLDEIKWEADGWPTINNGKGPSLTAVSPHGKAQQVELGFADDFVAPKLGPLWQWPHSFEPITKLENGQLILTSPSTNGTDLFGSVVAVQTKTGHYAATTLLTKSMQDNAKAGLFAFGDRNNAIGILVGGKKAEIIRVKQSKNESLAAIDFSAPDKTYLRTEVKEGHKFSFFVWDGKEWKRVGDADLEGDYLPPWDRGVRIALTVGGQENAAARFEWLRVVPTQ